MTKLFSHRAATWMFALALGIPFASFAADNNPPAKVKLDPAAINRDARLGNSYSSVVKKVAPSVVNIYSTRTARQPRYQQSPDDPYLNRFFGDDSSPRRGRRGGRDMKDVSLGSGVVVSEDG